MDKEEIKKWEEAGKYGYKIMQFARKTAKKDLLLVELAEKVEKEIEKLKVKSAFPINLSINEIAAHCSPQIGDEEICSRLLKIDLGVSVDGYLSDTASSLDFSDTEENKNLIKASEEALKKAIVSFKKDVSFSQIGKTIQETINSYGFASVRNLSGHQIQRYEIHAGHNIPNYESGNNNIIEDGIYAVEPFATTGVGIVQDGKESGIYMLINNKPIRDSFSRKILEYVEEEFKTIPFSKRWIIKKFGNKANLALKLLERNENLKHFKQLVEQTKKPVSHSEHTLLFSNGKAKVLTLDED